MPIGLQRRGSTYWLRRRVPKELLNVYGKAEITKSLGTKDRAEAKRRLIDEAYALEKEFDAKRAALANPPTAQQIEPEATSRLQRLRGGSARPPNIIHTMLNLSDSLDAELQKRGRISNQKAQETKAQNRRNDVSWDALAERWASERKPIEKTRRAHLSALKMFLTANPNLRPADTSKANFLAFKDHLIGEGQSLENMRTLLSRVKTLVNYGCDNDLIPVRAADGVKLPKSKKVGRVPYDDASLSMLFGGPVHHNGDRPAQGRGEASFWLPLIALYAGARLEEIAGLATDDLLELEINGGPPPIRAWFFRFRPDESKQRRLKTAASERLTPVHPELIRLGLIQYADIIRREGQNQLFPLLTAHANGKRAHRWGAWFSDYRRKDRGITDERMDFHSFRHTFKDAARECGMPEGLQRQIMGHEAKDVADGYGSGFSRKAAHEWIGRVRFPGMPSIPSAR